MPTHAQIAVLCDIGQFASFNDEKRNQVRLLMEDGYVRKNGERYELTPKGEKILTDRGAGLNES